VLCPAELRDRWRRYKRIGLGAANAEIFTFHLREKIIDFLRVISEIPLLYPAELRDQCKRLKNTRALVAGVTTRLTALYSIRRRVKTSGSSCARFLCRIAGRILGRAKPGADVYLFDTVTPKILHTLVWT
jgi:hypothetical protein